MHMTEFRRVLTGNKVIIIFLIFFLILIFSFMRERQDDLELLKSPDTKEEIRQEWLSEQKEGIQSFYESIKNMNTEKDKLLSVSIFAKPDSFVYKNILKTHDDFSSVKDVKLKEGCDRAVNVFYDFSIIYILGLIIIVYVTLTFFDERKKGLWQSVYTCKNGRFVLAAKRCAILLFASAVTATLFFVTSLCISFFIYGGTELLGAPIQSVMSLQKTLLDISVLSGLIYHLLMYILALYVNGLFVYIILSVMRNISIGVISCVAFYIIEILLSIIIQSANPAAFLRYFNLYKIADFRSCLTTYTNFAFGNVLINERSATTVFIIIMAIVGTFFAILAASLMKPYGKTSVFERLIENILKRIRRILSHMSGIGFELYKNILQNKGIYIIAAFVYLVISNINTESIMMNPARQLLNEFYEEHTCKIDKDMVELVENMEEEILIEEQRFCETLIVQRIQLDELKSQIMRAEKLSERGIEGWFVNSRGFSAHMGKQMERTRVVNTIIGMLALVFLIAPVYVSENAAGVRNIIRCTGAGRRKLYVRKCLYLIFTVMIVSFVIYFAEIYETLLNYSMKGLMVPVQNIEILESFPYRINILTYMLLWYALRSMVWLCAASFIMYVSVKSSRPVRAYIISLPVVLFAFLASGHTGMIAMAVISSVAVFFFIMLYLIYRQWNRR